MSSFLKFGEMELEMYIKARRVMYFYSLVNRTKEQAVYVFFMTQYHHRSEKSWVSNVLQDFRDLNIDSNFEYLENLSIRAFRKIVKREIRNYSFKILIQKKMQYKKLSRVDYCSLELQPYLYDPQNKINEKINLLKWRIFMTENVGKNSRGGCNPENIICHLCGAHTEGQEEIFNYCPFIKSHVELQDGYEESFSGSINSILVKKITKIANMMKS